MASALSAPAAVSAKKRMDWMDVMRGIAVLLVILFHTESQIRGNVSGYPAVFAVINDAVAPFRMPTLMFLSGMLLPRSLKKRASIYLRGKLFAVGWPYLLWSSVLVGLLAMTVKLTGNGSSLSDFGRIFYDPPSYLWYLAYLLIFYVGALGTSARVRQWTIPVALSGAAFVPDGNWSQMLYLLAFFLFGDLVARNWRDLERFLALPSVVTISAILGATAAVASVLGVVVRYQVWWAPAVVAAIFAALPATAALARTRAGRHVANAGKQSIVFYATHYVFLIIAFNLLARVGLDNALILSVILPVLAVAFGMLLVLLRRFRAVDALFVFPSGRYRGGLLP